jgi:uroporphyrinogen decarboxylase
METMDFEPNRESDFEQFLHVLRRDARPNHLPFYEHIASGGFIARRTGVPWDKMTPQDDGFWQTYVDFWLGMGYDEIPMEIPLNCALKQHENSEGKESSGSESHVTISNMAEFEDYDWPDESDPIDFSHFERVAGLLPQGVKIVGGVCAGPYEWATHFVGVEGLAMAIYMDPDFVKALFDKIRALHTSAVRQLASMDAIGALRQGDDLGFKTATFLPPDILRQHVFPTYKALAAEAHAQGKPFILHSCGNLAEVYDDIIDGCKIDAKHSFEDVILPVADFKAQYGHKVTALGGLDVDFICQASEDDLRAYTRKAVERCFEDGFWALGTGNSLTNYMPVENYLIVLDEGMKVTA